MNPLKAFDIQFVGLKVGEHIYKFEIDYKFFEYFQYDDFNNVSIIVDVNLVKKSSFLELNFLANGSVNVNCDLTNESYDEKLHASFNLVVNFGDKYNDENDQILILPHGEYEINVAHYIYELIVLSLPQKRVHPGVEDGTLDSDILKRLEDLSPTSVKNSTIKEDIDPRWEKLKKLITEK
jgi:uncharacterized metal-binding protein YceD (DUF177 family)